MLDERKANILRTVVEEYIETAQPVGSGHVAESSSLAVSSATVRNDMATLETDGYLAQPHTSAGRIPTEKGYRYFVDHVAVPARLASAEAHQIRSFFDRAHGELEQMLQDTTRLLADLTRYASVVIGPPHEVATVRSVQLVGLAPQVALVVVVLSNGAVDKHTVDLDAEASDEQLGEATEALAAELVGSPYEDLDHVKVAERRGAVIARQAVSVLRGAHHDGESVYVGGTSRVAVAFDAVAQVGEVLGILEEQFVVVTLLRDVLDRGMTVAIGTETGMEPLADCSVIVSPYEVAGEPAGTIGILGPTRMNYPQAMATVAVVGRRLGERLSEG